MRRARVSIAALLWLAACVGAPPRPLPEAPQPEGDGPIGRPFSVELVQAGQPLHLESVRGRVTLICALGDAAEQVVEICSREKAHFRDRLAVVGLATGVEPYAEAPFRVYRDPGGEALRKSMEIEGGSRVVVIGVPGRVLAVVEEAQLGGLRALLNRLLP